MARRGTSGRTGRIGDVADTAHWVAVYRAMESERPDAHFRDPWARRLAGVEGEDIVDSLRGGRGMAWPMIVRTVVLDEVILRTVRERRADLVLNLAAGLDTRPWRLDLPAALRWIDVDLPSVLDHKGAVMAAETPRCHYEPVAADLRSAAERHAVLARVGEGSRGLVLSEGLLIWLEAEEVAALAGALAACRGLRWWLADLASPDLLKMMQRKWGRQLEPGEARFRFAPAEGTGFFAPLGWREAEWHPLWDAARRLRRTMRGGWLWNLLARLSTEKRREKMRRFSGMMLLERAPER